MSNIIPIVKIVADATGQIGFIETVPVSDFRASGRDGPLVGVTFNANSPRSVGVTMAVGVAKGCRGSCVEEVSILV